MDPTDYTTWGSLNDHPIFGRTRTAINRWSHDASRYDVGPTMPSEFNADWYVHTDPPLPTEDQQAIADKDIGILSRACRAIQDAFGDLTYELVILDDLTTYVWVKSDCFTLDLYPNHNDYLYSKAQKGACPDDLGELAVFIDDPNVEDCEFRIDVRGLVERLRAALGTEQSGEREPPITRDLK